MVEILHVTSDDLLLDSFRLGRRVYESGFRPKHAISIWRGGTPIGLGVDAYFRFQGLSVHHTTIATSSYEGIGHQTDVVVKGLEHLIRSVCPEDGLLIIDDVYETGRTIESIVGILRKRARRNAPKDIRVAAVHRKRRPGAYDELPLLFLHDIPVDVWIDYPHELADLVVDDDPDDGLIRAKSPEIHAALREKHEGTEEVRVDDPYHFVSASQLLLDSTRLGVKIAQTGYIPDFLIAIWPGGVLAGLSAHEVFKYFLRKRGVKGQAPDHIALNTTKTHLSYRTKIIGLDYLVERVEHHHKLLIIDTTFRSGRMTSDVVNTLKGELRRNLDLEKVRIAGVYWNPDDKSTWTVRPFRLQPDYWLKKVNRFVVYPQSPHRFLNPREELTKHNPELKQILFG